MISRFKPHNIASEFSIRPQRSHRVCLSIQLWPWAYHSDQPVKRNYARVANSCKLRLRAHVDIDFYTAEKCTKDGRNKKIHFSYTFLYVCTNYIRMWYFHCVTQKWATSLHLPSFVYKLLLPVSILFLKGKMQ